ncbi:MAG: TIGR03862 family flavoprotein [Rhodospirillaceae bacterium]|nr:TIGR03862 family flavoprotein [Rhodospirillaceae bacterium]
MNTKVAIIGGGPAGLMAAETLATAGIPVDVFESMPTPGRKFLRAGIGGLNLTRSDDIDTFLSHYGSTARQWLAPALRTFGPQEVRQWADSLGADTFVGSSGRVFPKAMKTAPLLRAWMNRLSDLGVTLHTRHIWSGWADDGQLVFATPNGPRYVTADATILALGGASWPRLGSTGSWCPHLAAKGIEIAPWLPSNCGFDVAWSPTFRDRFAGTPLPTATFGFGTTHIRSHAMITSYGLEGGAIYALSAAMRDTITATGSAIMTIDLAPDRDEATLARALSRPRGARSFATHLNRNGLGGVRAALLRETIPAVQALSATALAHAAKTLTITCLRPRPLDEAISSAGGITRSEVDETLMLRRLPGVFCAGEMLDWEAQTGGFLLTACLALGHAAGKAAENWISLPNRVAAMDECF